MRRQGNTVNNGLAQLMKAPFRRQLKEKYGMEQ